MKNIWSWHKQLQLSALMDFENFFEKWTTCNEFVRFPTLKIIYLKVNTVNL